MCRITQLIPLALLILSAGATCVRTQQAPPPPEEELVLSLGPSGKLLKGTVLHFTGSGFPKAERGIIQIYFKGVASSDEDGLVQVDFSIAPSVHDTRNLSYTVDESFLNRFGKAPSLFNGNLEARTSYGSGAPEQRSALPALFTLHRTLTPRLDSLAQQSLFMGSVLKLNGQDFLQASEGGTRITLEGSFSLDEGGAIAVNKNLDGAYHSRDRIAARVDPTWFGLKPGRFDGTITLRNRHHEGAEVKSNTLGPLTLYLSKSYISEITPTQFRRGQKIILRGRGFLETGGGATVWGMVYRLEGQFATSQGTTDLTGANAIELIPDLVSYEGDEAEYILRVEKLPTGEIVGLGANPGTFSGTVTPITVYGGTEQVNLPFSTSLRVNKQLQVVYLKFLPDFTDGLRIFGLRNVEAEIRKRVQDVLERDYSYWNLEFRTVRPTDFAEYSVIEIGGRDPNGMGLFGLDNTMGKDLGNLRFDDVIGGMNAESREAGFYAYGGVFAESFLAMSAAAHEALPIASNRFDLIFDSFRPDRGGTAVAATEFPGGPRKTQIELAIRVLGNLIGNTACHEIGHSLGMAINEGSFHNIFFGEKQIMDSGGERSFEERAELDGKGPAIFTLDHQQYLDDILPLD